MLPTYSTEKVLGEKDLSCGLESVKPHETHQTCQDFFTSLLGEEDGSVFGFGWYLAF